MRRREFITLLGGAVAMHRGATLALHSAVGFGLSALGAWGAGVALDAAGGPAQPTAWLALFVLLAAGIRPIRFVVVEGG